MEGKKLTLACLTVFVVLFGFKAHFFARVFYKKNEALKLAFPGAERVERKTLFLNEDQIREIQQTSKTKVDSKMVVYYTGKLQEKVLGYAFFETNTVRTMPATVMVVLTPTGSVKFVEVLAFYEPPDYIPPKNWLGLFNNKTIEDNIHVKKGIPNISGASLTANSIAVSVRRTLGIFHKAIANRK